MGFGQFVGEIKMIGFNFAPQGWAKCDGQLLPISQNTALFSLLGTIYGGDGETTFALPDLRGRVPLHAGNGPGLPGYNIGSKSGNTNTTLATANLPPHNHPAQVNAYDQEGNSAVPAGTILAKSGAGDPDYTNQGSNSQLAPGALTIGNTGSGQQFSNMQPYLTINYIIALVGNYPSQ